MISLFLFNHFNIIKFMLAASYTYQNKNEKSFSNSYTKLKLLDNLYFSMFFRRNKTGKGKPFY